jgi:hypothetical protein
MGQVNHQDQRDVAMYRAWVDGARQGDIAEQYGIDQSNVSRAIDRVADALPPVEKAQEVRRAVDLCDDMLATYVPGARERKPAHSREARGWLQLKAKWLGIDRREVQVQGQVEHLHSWEPGPTVAEVLDDWRRQGIIQGELTRMDQ